MGNLMGGLLDELNRNRELLVVYEGLPNNVGALGAIFIRQSIEAGEQAIKSGDVVAMVTAYKDLESTE